jgi:ankyrin repeat domain-containing protein 50
LSENSDTKLKCLHALLLTEPEDDLAYIRRTKGNKVKGTCEWVLDNKQYVEWVTADKSQLLRLTGSPGIGKTTIASFLVDELKERAKYSGSTLFAFFLCDNKDERRRTATAVLRALLIQLLRQQPSFFKYVQPEYDKYGKDKFNSMFCENFDALWRVFEAVLRDTVKQSIFILIDALDECEEGSKDDLARAFNRFFHQESPRNKNKSDTPVQSVRFIVTHRLELGIKKVFKNGSMPLDVDGGLINRDLSKFIRERTENLRDDFDLDSETTDQIRDALEKKSEGTFLWVSLVLESMDKRDIQANITKLLDQLPSSLTETYERILQKIKSENEEIASLILRTVFIARRPLTVKELATISLLKLGKYEKSTAPTDQDLNEWKTGYLCCGSFLKLDEIDQTVHLVHQSAKDFLKTNNSLREDLARFYSEHSKLDSLMLQICWGYLSLKEFQEGNMIVERRLDGRLLRQHAWKYHTEQYHFLKYAIQEWEEHAIAACPTWVDQSGMEGRTLDKLPTLRDLWLLRAAEKGQEAAVGQLLDRGAGIDSKDKDSWTPLSWAAKNGHEAVVKLLLEKGAELEPKDDYYGQTPLSRAAENGHETVMKLLLEKGAELESKSNNGQTPLSWAAENGHEAIVKLLLEKGAELESKSNNGQTPLSWATENGHEAVVELLQSQTNLSL